MDYIMLSFLAGLFTWLVTVVGSLGVFFIKKTNDRLISFLLGFGGGIMLAASFFSLILPAIDFSKDNGQTSYLICGIGVLAGVVALILFDIILDKVNSKNNSIIGKKDNILLTFAITLHNIPEGMAIGVAFAAALLLKNASLSGAFVLALGIGIQNFPEGLAVALPLSANGTKKSKAFLIGALSAIVEPISAVLGAVLVIAVKNILPFILTLAAGAMLFVVVEELIPSGKNDKTGKICTIGVMCGFIIMMVLDLMFD